MNEAKFRKLWSRIEAKIKSKELKSLKGINSVDDFLAVMAKQVNRKLFWDAVNVEYAKVGIFLGEWEDFEQLYGGDDKPLAKYEGVYEQSTMKIDVTIKAKEDKLVASVAGFDFEFKNKGTNTFITDSNNIEIIFTQDGSGVITGAKLTTTSLAVKEYLKGNDSLNFIKKSSTPSPSKPDDSTPSKKETVWDCIEKYNKENNAPQLYRREQYRFEKINFDYDNKPTIFMYYEDGKAVWAFSDGQKPIQTGKWQCNKDGGYTIKWSNGDITPFGSKEVSGLSDNFKNTPTNTSKNLCPNGYKEGCVSKNDIFGKKKALKACSKCDLVKEVQENPEIKARIFRLQKEAGQPEKTDNVFGPIMLAAIKEFQSSHGINPTGNVGELTLTKINPSQASQFYLDRGGKKFKSGDKNGGAVDYLKAQRIKDDFDEADGVIYFMIGVGLKDKNAACSALIKSMERGEIESAEYYDARKCSEISGFPSYADFIKLYRTKLKSGKTPTTVQEPKVNDTVVNKTDVKPTNKPEVKPIYNRSSRQVLRPDEEL